MKRRPLGSKRYERQPAADQRQSYTFSKACLRFSRLVKSVHRRHFREALGEEGGGLCAHRVLFTGKRADANIKFAKTLPTYSKLAEMSAWRRLCSLNANSSTISLLLISAHLSWPVGRVCLRHNTDERKENEAEKRESGPPSVCLHRCAAFFLLACYQMTKCLSVVDCACVCVCLTPCCAPKSY